MKQSNVIDLTENLAQKAALISLKYKLPMADSLIYSTVQTKNAILWTQDEHFQSLPNVKYKKSRKISN